MSPFSGFRTVSWLGSDVAGMLRLVQEGQNPPQLRHQVAGQLPPAILLGQSPKSLVPDPHTPIVSRNVPRCNTISTSNWLPPRRDRLASPADAAERRPLMPAMQLQRAIAATLWRRAASLKVVAL